jgi:DNA-binding CsgD family transcriptional regulator
MSERKLSKVDDPGMGKFSIHPRTFEFVDKLTGTQRFRVKANADGSMPVDEAASLLVVQCLMRGQMPNDFIAMVAADSKFLRGVRQRARRMIHACPVKMSRIQLTARKWEVLRGIQQGLANKAIGVRLNLSERTVKFHVSSLLNKFGVATRAELMREAAELFSAEKGPKVVDSLQPDADAHRVAEELRFSGESLVRMNTLDRRSRG